MQNVPGFYKSQKHNTSGNVYGYFEFPHSRRKCDIFHFFTEDLRLMARFNRHALQ
jgi:hypothetical protein